MTTTPSSGAKGTSKVQVVAPANLSFTSTESTLRVTAGSKSADIGIVLDAVPAIPIPIITRQVDNLVQRPLVPKSFKNVEVPADATFVAYKMIVHVPNVTVSRSKSWSISLGFLNKKYTKIDISYTDSQSEPSTLDFFILKDESFEGLYASCAPAFTNQQIPFYTHNAVITVYEGTTPKLKYLIEFVQYA